MFCFSSSILPLTGKRPKEPADTIITGGTVVSMGRPAATMYDEGSRRSDRRHDCRGLARAHSPNWKHGYESRQTN